MKRPRNLSAPLKTRGQFSGEAGSFTFSTRVETFPEKFSLHLQPTCSKMGSVQTSETSAESQMLFRRL